MYLVLSSYVKWVDFLYPNGDVFELIESSMHLGCFMSRFSLDFPPLLVSYHFKIRVF